MSKEQKTTELALTKDEATKALSNPELLKKTLDSLVEGRDLAGFEFEPGVTEKVLIIGAIEVPAMGKPGQFINSIKFITSDGSPGAASDAVLRTALESKAVAIEKGEIPPFPVQITCTGVRTSPVGDYKTFKITELVKK